MPTNPLQKEVVSQLVKWGFLGLMTLVGAGLVSIAHRDVYTKEQVDEKLSYEKQLQAALHADMNRRLDNIEQGVENTNILLIQLIKERSQ